jgi:hypothetical protein
VATRFRDHWGPTPSTRMRAMVIFSIAVACSSTSTTSAPSAGSGSPFVATGSPVSSDCAQADPGWAKQLDMPSGSYVYVAAGTASNGHDAWVIAKNDGAVWATDVDPSSTPKSGGLIVPLNDKARGDAAVGKSLSAEAIANLFPEASAEALSACK